MAGFGIESLATKWQILGRVASRQLPPTSPPFEAEIGHPESGRPFTLCFGSPFRCEICVAQHLQPGFNF